MSRLTPDPRILGCAAALREAELADISHTAMRRRLRDVVAEFRQRPTTPNLRALVEMAISYQDSFLLGPNRVGAKPDEPDRDPSTSRQSPGGRARAEKLSPKRRSAIARKAAETRWGARP